MCGIAGVIGPDPEQVGAAVRRSADALRHRGPDDAAVELHRFGDGWLGLAHHRLAVLDPSPLGRQPMAHPPTGCRLVYNGEVYNFPALCRELERDGEQFRGHSDTEVLLAGLARHGPQFVTRLEGMYAFAAFDPRGPSLTFARDPLGIKPLYLARTPHGLAFASEVRAVLATGLVPAELSRAGVAGLLAYGSVQQPLTLFERVRMFEPGAWQVVRPGRDGVRCDPPRVWWRTPRPDPAAAGDAVGTTRRLLGEAVRDHLQSDVPVGLFLSAGLDSSTLAGLAAAHRPAVRAFTVGFAGQHDQDEVAVATETARRLGLPHTAIDLPPADAEGAFADWLAAADQPSMDGLNTFVVSRAVRREGIKVALSGLGADELFGGYTSFRDVPRLRAVMRAVGWMPPAVRAGLGAAATLFRPPSVRDKTAEVLRGRGGLASLTLHRRRVLSDRQLRRLKLTAIDLGLTADWLPAFAHPPPEHAELGWTVSAVESRYYQGHMLLRDADANGMAHGLEIRVPFLDRRLVEFVNRLPDAARFPRGRPAKWLLREAAADVLHADLLARPKTGFTLPLQRWMLGPLRPVCEEAVRAVRECGLLDPAGVTAVWDTFLSEAGRQPWAWTRALAVVALGDYLRRVGEPASPPSRGHTGALAADGEVCQNAP